FPGAAVAVTVGVGGAVAAVVSGRAQRILDERSVQKPGVFAHRVGRISDPIQLGVKPAAATVDAAGRVDRVPPFVERDRTAERLAAVEAGGFVLVVGDSTAGKTRLTYEVLRRARPRYTLVRPRDRAAVPAAVRVVAEKRRSLLWLDDLEVYL